METFLTHGSLFAGIGGFDLGFERAGIKTLWQVEIDEWCRKLLAHRFPEAQQHGDINECFPELTSLAAASPAKTSPTLASAPELPEAVPDSGGQWCVPFAWYDRATQLWRTWQRCLDGEWAEFSETWPRAGMTRNGIAYQRQPLVPLTSAIEHFLWPTPVLNSLNNRPGMGPKSGWGLQAAVRMWPTPVNKPGGGSVMDGGSNSRKAAKRRGMWPTPKGSPSGPDFARTNREQSGGDDLATAVARGQVPTPQAHDWRSGKGFSPDGRGHSPQLRHLSGGQLNPTWVEWLMGFPLGWTALEDSETPSSRKSRNGLLKESTR